jgi:hypothetical protein
MEKNITLAEAIRQVRTQIEEAQREGDGKSLHFRAKSVEVELSIAFTWDGEVGGALKAWVADLSGKMKLSNEHLHKVKLVLEPVTQDGADVFVVDTQIEKD